MTSTTDLFTDAHGLVWENGGQDTDDHLTHGNHETYLIDLMISMLPPLPYNRVVKGRRFLDVGAHVGLWSLRMARHVEWVGAIEANPKTKKVLDRNVHRNYDNGGKVIDTFGFAAWDERVDLALTDENDKDTGGSTRCVTEGPPKAYGMPIDASYIGHVNPSLIKIDVEGAEAHVLRGAREMVIRAQPVLLIEMHDHYHGSHIREEVIAFLDEVDYHWNDNLVFGGSYYILAKPNSLVSEPDIEVVKAGS